MSFVTSAINKKNISDHQEADIAIGSITITGPRSTVCDFSVSYYDTGIGFIAHIPRRLSKVSALLRPYQWNVWISLLVTIILSGPVGWWIAKRSARDTIVPMSLKGAYALTLKVFIQQGSQSK